MKETFSFPVREIKDELDVGSVLHEIAWPNGIVPMKPWFKLCYWKKWFIIIFYGYTDGPLTRESTHNRSTTLSTVRVSVTLDKDETMKDKKISD